MCLFGGSADVYAMRVWWFGGGVVVWWICGCDFLCDLLVWVSLLVFPLVVVGVDLGFALILPLDLLYYWIWGFGVVTCWLFAWVCCVRLRFCVFRGLAWGWMCA